MLNLGCDSSIFLNQHHMILIFSVVGMQLGSLVTNSLIHLDMHKEPVPQEHKENLSSDKKTMCGASSLFELP